MTLQTDIQPDFVAIKSKQNAAWASGDYAVVGTTLQIVGENLAEALDLAPGATVLDVAAGNGNATLAMARRWHKVTSTDYVPTLLKKGRVRAQAENLNIAFETADAEALPYENGAFDSVVSTFGVMFAPNQKQAAAELLRVCKSGGSIGMANWTPSGFIGQLFKTLGGHVSPPPGVKSPALWGDISWLEETFAPATSIDCRMRQFNFRYRDAQHFVDLFRTLYGPVHKAFLALDTEGRDALEHDIIALVDRMNVATDGTVKVPGDYLEIVIKK
ncbi:class I SAM-dependent methyltransferase [Aliiroseovarius sp. YM-037]|uniref:class I SAM-dependent methyltransferase n=1 Tax=Aliiroseovarius sp. YM-037 TaxID=3341728 RepID=UPI003A8024BB